MTPVKEAPLTRRAGLGFQGGQILTLKVTDADLDALRQTLKKDEIGWHEVQATDGAVLVDLDQVVYLRVESDDQRVGF